MLRYFDYDKDALIKENLYILLPLQIYRLRAELDRMTAKNDERARQDAIIKAKDLTETIAKDIIKLNKEEKISSYDMNRIMLALQELFAHLNDRYQVNEKLNDEVRNMMRTLIDKNTLEKLDEAEKKIKQSKKQVEQAEQELQKEKVRITEAIREMLLDGEPIEKIIKYTKVSKSEIEDIQKTM